MTTKLRLFFPTLLIALACAMSAYAALPQSVRGEPVTSLAPLVEEASPAVVNIRVSQTVTRRNSFGDDAFRRFFGLPDGGGSGAREISSAGSGVIVDARRGASPWKLPEQFALFMPERDGSMRSGIFVKAYTPV